MFGTHLSKETTDQRFSQEARHESLQRFSKSMLIIVLLWSLFILLLPKAASYVGALFPVLLGYQWSVALRARLAAVGFSSTRWWAALYELVVAFSCLSLIVFDHGTRLVVPGLFLLLHIPLAILREKPDKAGGPVIGGKEQP
jgi:hypothetical protein